jgi:hypothetical protein
MRINQYKVKTPQKPTNKTYVIGNGQIERELRVELERYAEEVRDARVELDGYKAYMAEYERRGKLLDVAQTEANKVPGLVTEIQDLRAALLEMSKVLRDDDGQNTVDETV